MTGENDQTQARTLNTRDAVTGEELEIVYHPETGVILINCDVVTRAPALETEEGITVFHRSPDNRLFTVGQDSLSTLHL